MLKSLNKYIIWLLAIVFVAAIGFFSATFTVRFTETAVRTTFGKAGDNAVITEPGIKLKWPAPFQSVTKYDNRNRIIQTRSETQQTADDFQIIVEAYMTYRVSDPLSFYRSFSDAGDHSIDHFRKAEDDVLRDRLRSQLGETSKFRVDELFTAELGSSKIPELETRLQDLMATGGTRGTPLSEYGIEVVSVGIDRIVFPENTTSRVMERMQANRSRLAQSYESEGLAVAQRIRAEADSAADKIRAFARRRASEIRAQGELEAAQYLAQQNSNPELAVFLANVEMMRDSLSKRTTLILSTSDFGLGIFSPDVLRDLQAGQLPVDFDPSTQAAAGGSR